ncbi:hypothetical protein jhhlp_008130 [Lomentospora prolificans]|uniref:NAD-dependent epimerase/dehydratase domain-containing protein n=1 Tax=Lomentospora prolificans TaxID=41688 RepID=A0A2N3MZM6_9PEZI|nr:hypothetical protein jhhlp_008130 [Lomentospora prolificans]
MPQPTILVTGSSGHLGCGLMLSLPSLGHIAIDIDLRFFPEADDDEDRRNALGDENLKVLELCYWRADIADVVSACVCATKKGKETALGQVHYQISESVQEGRGDACAAEQECGGGGCNEVPGCNEVFEKVGWRWLSRGLTGCTTRPRAVRELGWEPQYTFGNAVEKGGQG